MKITETPSPQDLQDMGQYFRGLLVVMGLDGHLAAEQQERIRRFGSECGFSQKFIDESIQGVLQNKFLPRVPPQFHSPEIAERFLREAAQVAVCDGHVHPEEQKWLREAARLNNLEEHHFQGILDLAEARG